MRWGLAIAVVCAAAPAALAQPVEPDPVVSPAVEIHGFAGEGGFVSTANDYIGSSSTGTLELFEAGLNVSTEPTDRLRFGLQLFSRTVGDLHDAAPRVDFAYGDYHWRPWLGIRAGIVKMPFGLYNEYIDIDAARLPILLPQSVYPVRDRDALLSHTGFALYGNYALGSAGELDYQAWLGTLTIPENSLELNGAELDSVHTKYVTGAQVFWSPPLEGLRLGATFLRTSIDFHITLDPAVVEALVMAGAVPADYDGKLVVSQRPDQLGVASVEYQRDDWLFAAEYSRWLKHQQSTLPDVLPAFDQDEERLYGMVTYRLSERFETGGYYAVHHLDVHDRRGRDGVFGKPYYAYQRDLAATFRWDVNAHWVWKLEGHFIDGTADLLAAPNPDPVRFWGLFLFKTTVSF
jgi:hypothetical protein